MFSIHIPGKIRQISTNGVLDCNYQSSSRDETMTEIKTTGNLISSSGPWGPSESKHSESPGESVNV